MCAMCDYVVKGWKLFANVPGIIVQAISFSMATPDERWRKKGSCH